MEINLRHEHILDTQASSLMPMKKNYSSDIIKINLLAAKIEWNDNVPV